MCAWVRCCGGASKSSMRQIIKDGLITSAFIGTGYNYRPTWASSFGGHAPNLVQNPTAVNMSLARPSSGNRCGTVFFSPKIDVTNLSAIRLTYNVISLGAPGWLKVVVSDTLEDLYTIQASADGTVTSGGATISVDVSALTGEKYVGVYLQNNASNSADINVTQLFGE